MKQIIEYAGTDNLGTDLYVIDDTRKEFCITAKNMQYIRNTMRQGDPDLINEKGESYRIVNVVRSVNNKSEQKTVHIKMSK